MDDSLFTPLADWLRQYDALEFLATLGAILGVGWALWKFLKAVFPSLRYLVLFVEALGRLPAFMRATEARQDRTEALVREVRHEVLPNNGSSMRDELVTVGLRVEKTEAKLSRDHERFAAVGEELGIRERLGLGIPPTTGPLISAHPSRQPFPADTSE